MNDMSMNDYILFSMFIWINPGLPYILLIEDERSNPLQLKGTPIDIASGPSRQEHEEKECDLYGSAGEG